MLLILLVVLVSIALVAFLIYAQNHPELFDGYTVAQAPPTATATATLAPTDAPQDTPAPKFGDLPAYADGTLQVHMLDVGAGDAIILISPQGATMLLDAGDVGAENVIIPYLEDLGIARLDIVMQSHKHADHIGGMQKVLESGKFEVGCYLRPAANAGSDTKMYKNLLAAIANMGWPDHQLYFGDDAVLDAWDSSVDFTVYSPIEGMTYKNPNDTSIVMKAEYGTTSILLTGDAERPAENAILAALTDPSELAADVLKLAHHSSESSTSKNFLWAVNPVYALISCSAKHDNPDVVIMQRLRDLGILDSNIYITLYQGWIITRLDGVNITFTTEKEYAP